MQASYSARYEDRLFCIDQHLIGSMRNFVYLITSDKQSFIVDSQKDLSAWEKTRDELGSTLKGVLLTHTHHDHVAGVDELAEKYDVPFYLHRGDIRGLNKKSQLVQSRTKYLNEGDKLRLGKIDIEILHTPGHSAGECCFLIRGEKHWHLFTGDTVFVGNVGRTDLETGSTPVMLQTLARLRALPASTVIYPGHDYGATWTTTIERELRESAAFTAQTVAEFDALP
ncbi:MAG TPA: MBL fold metallo-hydrolase [Oligoflexia bacterium]|nr:MBL fold metallo-hydrolase [Oligoflexia bacterium]